MKKILKLINVANLGFLALLFAIIFYPTILILAAKTDDNLYQPSFLRSIKELVLIWYPTFFINWGTLITIYTLIAFKKNKLRQLGINLLIAAVILGILASGIIFIDYLHFRKIDLRDQACNVKFDNYKNHLNIENFTIENVDTDSNGKNNGLRMNFEINSTLPETIPVSFSGVALAPGDKTSTFYLYQDNYLPHEFEIEPGRNKYTFDIFYMSDALKDGNRIDQKVNVNVEVHSWSYEDKEYEGCLYSDNTLLKHSEPWHLKFNKEDVDYLY